MSKSKDSVSQATVLGEGDRAITVSSSTAFSNCSRFRAFKNAVTLLTRTTGFVEKPLGSATDLFALVFAIDGVIDPVVRYVQAITDADEPKIETPLMMFMQAQYPTLQNFCSSKASTTSAAFIGTHHQVMNCTKKDGKLVLNPEGFPNQKVPKVYPLLLCSFQPSPSNTDVKFATLRDRRSLMIPPGYNMWATSMNFKMLATLQVVAHFDSIAADVIPTLSNGVEALITEAQELLIKLIVAAFVIMESIPDTEFPWVKAAESLLDCVTQQMRDAYMAMDQEEAKKFARFMNTTADAKTLTNLKECTEPTSWKVYRILCSARALIIMKVVVFVDDRPTYKGRAAKLGAREDVVTSTRAALLSLVAGTFTLNEKVGGFNSLTMKKQKSSTAAGKPDKQGSDKQSSPKSKGQAAKAEEEEDPLEDDDDDEEEDEEEEEGEGEGQKVDDKSDKKSPSPKGKTTKQEDPKKKKTSGGS